MRILAHWTTRAGGKMLQEEGGGGRQTPFVQTLHRPPSPFAGQLVEQDQSGAKDTKTMKMAFLQSARRREL